jgi:Amidases related to nicotinamidase
MKRALLVIDVQNEYFEGGAKPVTYPEGSFENILSAIDMAEAKGIPVILIQHSSTKPGSKAFVKDTKGWQIPDEVLKRKYDCIIEKNYPGSFTGTELEAVLKSHGIDTVTICGYMTQMCCDTTSRQAFHMGYKVEFLSDATGTLDFTNYAGSITAAELHNAVLVIQAAAFSKVIGKNDWAKSLEE